MNIHEATQTTLTIFADDQLVIRTKRGTHGADADLTELFADHYNKDLRFLNAVHEDVEVQEGVQVFEVGMQWTPYHPNFHQLIRVVARTEKTLTLQCWEDGRDLGTRLVTIDGTPGDCEWRKRPHRNGSYRPKWSINFELFPFHAVISGATDTVFANGGE